LIRVQNICRPLCAQLATLQIDVCIVRAVAYPKPGGIFRRVATRRRPRPVAARRARLCASAHGWHPNQRRFV